MQQATLEEINQILKNKDIYAFFKKNITDGYMENAYGHEKEMKELLDKAFLFIEDSLYKGIDIKVIINTLSEDIFQMTNPDFWFYKVYKKFKRDIKPPSIFNLYKDSFLGSRILNIGCGDGVHSHYISEQGFDVTMTDILDYRDKSTLGLPFKLMTDPTVIPFPDKSVDTALLLGVLHHVSPEDLLPLLKEAKRVSTRVIVEEECFGVQENKEEFEEVIASDERLQEFIKKPNDVQIQYIKLLDFFGNVVIVRESEINFPFTQKSINQWRQLFSELGFKTKKTIVLGFKGRFHRTSRVAFILETL